MKPSLALLAIFLSLLAAAPARAQPLPTPSPSAPLFRNRPFGPKPPPTPTPAKRIKQETRPIPVGWFIAGGAIVALLIVALLYRSVRAWRSSNFFDRQYRFPTGGAAAVRLGGHKCGGHMATIHFGARQAEGRGPQLETKDT